MFGQSDASNDPEFCDRIKGLVQRYGMASDRPIGSRGYGPIGTAHFFEPNKAGYRCYRWLQNICGLELILKEEELIRVPNFENFIKILA